MWNVHFCLSDNIFRHDISEAFKSIWHFSPCLPLGMSLAMSPGICYQAPVYVTMHVFLARSVGHKADGRKQHQQREIPEKCFAGADYVCDLPCGAVCL